MAPPAASPPIWARSREAVTRTLASDLLPLVLLHDDVRTSFPTRVDLAGAGNRLRLGRPAFDVVTVLRSAGSLDAAFASAVDALEAAGLAPTVAASTLRAGKPDATALAVAWAIGERPPRAPDSRLARRAAALVGGAVLRGAAEAVVSALDIGGWKWPNCPCCGGAPDFGLHHDTRRMLVCVRCDTIWRGPPRGCLGCGADTPPTIAHVLAPFLGYTLTICNRCGRYLKERHGADPYQPVVERELTAELGAAAERREKHI